MPHTTKGEQVLTNCTVGGPIFVHVKNGRITRIRPMILDKTDAPSWAIEAHGRKFFPPRKVALAPSLWLRRQEFIQKIGLNTRSRG